MVHFYPTQTSSQAPLPESVRLSELRQVPIPGPVASTSRPRQVNQLARPQPLALGGEFPARRDEMKIRRLRHNLVRRKRRLALPFVPEKARALADREAIEHRLVRHRAPAHREINRHQRGRPIVAINFPVQNARIELKAGQRFEVELAVIELRVVRLERRLGRLSGQTPDSTGADAR